MEDVLRDLIYYAELAVGIGIWIVISCFLVAGIESVLFRFFPRLPPPDAIKPPDVAVEVPEALRIQ